MKIAHDCHKGQNGRTYFERRARKGKHTGGARDGRRQTGSSATVAGTGLEGAMVAQGAASSHNGIIVARSWRRLGGWY